MGLHSLAPTPPDRIVNPPINHQSVPWALVLPPLTPILQPKELHGEQSIFLMPSTEQATSSTDNVQLIICALADYAKETGIDLSKNPFAAKLEQSGSHDVILQLLQERAKAFKEYRDGKRRLISCLNPAVKVLHRFLGILSEAVGQVSRTYHLVGLFDVTSSDPLPSSKRFVCWDRYSPRRTSLGFSFQSSPVTYEYVGCL